MLTVTFITPQGRPTPCTTAVGTTLMMVALVNGIDGVLAECGGSLVCGTCHVYVDRAHLALLDAPDAAEDAMLGMTAAERRPNSRLSCQITLGETHDGLVVYLPETQV
ncbi:MAG: 2Fe-2S iron-sulfur cluster-binding protein [Pseudomonadota bacterium]